MPIKLSALEEKVRWQADMQRATKRHTSEEIRREITDSVRRFRELISDHGHPYFLRDFTGLTPVGVGLAKSDPSVNLPFGVVRIEGVDPPCLRIYGFDVACGDKYEELTRVEFSQRNLYQEVCGQPLAFFVYDETSVAILPAPDRAYRYVLWYLPDIRPLINDNDEFHQGLVGGEEWVTWDVCQKLAARDNYPPMFAAAVNSKKEIEAEIVHKAGKLVTAGGIQRRDTYHRDKAKASRRRWWK